MRGCWAGGRNRLGKKSSTSPSCYEETSSCFCCHVFLHTWRRRALVRWKLLGALRWKLRTAVAAVKARDDQSNLLIKAVRSVFRMDLFPCKLLSRLHLSRSRYRWYQVHSLPSNYSLHPYWVFTGKKKGAGGGEKRIRVVKAERKRSFTCVSVNTASKQGAWEQKRRDCVISLSTADVVAPRVLRTGKVSLSLSRPSRMSHEAQNTTFFYFFFLMLFSQNLT